MDKFYKSTNWLLGFTLDCERKTLWCIPIVNMTIDAIQKLQDVSTVVDDHNFRDVNLKEIKSKSRDYSTSAPRPPLSKPPKTPLSLSPYIAGLQRWWGCCEAQVSTTPTPTPPLFPSTEHKLLNKKKRIEIEAL